jgi:hypothetical protein
MATEAAADAKLPVATCLGGRKLDVPRSHQMAERALHRPPDRGNQRRVGNIPNVDVDGIEREHAMEKCKSGTVEFLRITGESGLDLSLPWNNSQPNGELRPAAPPLLVQDDAHERAVDLHAGVGIAVGVS